MPKTYRRNKPPKKPDLDYVQLWRLVDGAIMDTFKHHPEYINYKYEHIVRNSIAKRVVGNVKSFVEPSMKGRVRLKQVGG